MKTHKPKQRAQSAGKIFVISGPSGSGKTTLLEKLLKVKKISSLLAKSVSFTTRPKRPAEVHGRDYFFISNREFRRLLREEKILEWTKFLGYYYGTPRDFVEGRLRRGKFVLLCLDLAGTKQIKRLFPGRAVTVFIIPPSLEALKERIRGRGDHAAKGQVTKRLSLAGRELQAAAEYDHAIINRNLRQAVAELADVIRGYKKSLKQQRGKNALHRTGKASG